MADRDVGEPLLRALRAVAAWLAAEAVPGALIGGVAVSLVSRPRTTRDIDVLALPNEKQLGAFLASGATHGILPRVSEALAFAARSRVLLLRHDPTGVPIDLALGALGFERDVVRRAANLDLGGFSIPVAMPGDLVVLKAVAHRPVDAADIDAILSMHPEIDIDAARRTVAEFARLLESPEILEDLDRLIARARPEGR